ncbi:hypothetical protein [Azoarcus sp. DN11]|uniref:hypothetical protein n=1 Tax=Azoarcus sp. DN11 TaxID=356837 RepID=UPI0013E38365|nr:hypothetical protein [Azoarcus sp. DN11]
MELEYLEYDCEVIELDDLSAHSSDAQADETAEAAFASWFTDGRSGNGSQASARKS